MTYELEPAPPRNLRELDSRDIADSPRIMAMLFEGKTHEQIADALGMDRSCVTRKIHRLLDTREFQNALMAEWIKRYGEMKIVDAKVAFKHLTRLVSQGITRHVEKNQDIMVTERKELVTVNLRNYDAEIEAELKRALQANGFRKQLDTAQAAP